MTALWRKLTVTLPHKCELLVGQKEEDSWEKEV
jgi:hypothetical protein